MSHVLAVDAESFSALTTCSAEASTPYYRLPVERGKYLQDLTKIVTYYHTLKLINSRHRIY